MGENIFDDVSGEFTLSKFDFQDERYHARFGKIHIDADGPWVDKPFKSQPNIIIIKLNK